MEEDSHSWIKLARFLEKSVPRSTPFPPFENIDLPTVSIIIPTNGRPEFIPFVIERIMKQSYPSRLISEVVIVDDSSNELLLSESTVAELSQSLLVRGTTLRYVHLEKLISVGAKRNPLSRKLRAMLLFTGMTMTFTVPIASWYRCRQ